MLKRFSLILAVLAVVLFSSSAYCLEEVGADSRIRTLIYGKNDVYRIITSFGYQTTIEFEEDEKIKTISLGNSSSFKITPQKNRIFVRALQGGQLTNMIVITDKRTYQIELSSIFDSLDEVMYVVKFYYPDTFSDEIPGVSPSQSGRMQSNQAMVVPEVNIGGGQPYNSLQQSLNFTPPNNMVFNSPVASNAPLNYNYSLTGPDSLSPSEVFDDGIRTYIKFQNYGTPVFRYSTPDGKSLIPVPVNFVKQGEYYVLDGVTPKLTVYFGSEFICIYNESINTNIQ